MRVFIGILRTYLPIGEKKLNYLRTCFLDVPPLILQSSARPKGNTYKVSRHLAEVLEADHLDLLSYKIYPFNYEQVYPADDDFFQLVEAQILPRQQIIFASPVYWYSMSGPMKIFFDRLSDLLKSRKELGRQLREKRMSVLSVGNDDVVNDSFFDAFRLSAEYLGMTYGPEWHSWLEGPSPRLEERPA
ncbi:MAG: flavodoxin family protein [Lewinella sp.]